jgi:transposase-like protein
MALLELLRKEEQGADPQFLRDGVRRLAQELMDAEVTEAIGAAPYERTDKRVTSRTGVREREWDTRVGTIELAIPKLRQGSDFPSLLEPRRRHERALLAVVQEAYVHGVSTRNVDALAEALGLKGISKDQVSRICKELDGQVHAFRTRPLSGDYPYLMLDATFEKVRENGRVVSMAVVQVLTGTTWQRCRVHFMRNALSTVPTAAQQMVAATLRTIFAQPDREGARETIARISRLFERRFPKLVAVLQDAEVDILAFHSFPLEHRRQVWSTNALERLNREVGRRCEVVGIFPNRPALLQLVGAVLEEQNDEWAVGRRYFSQESMNKLTEPSQEEVVQALLELQTA